MIDYRQYLRPDYVRRFASLALRGRIIAEGYLAGRNRSHRRGGSTEFAEHREYRAGDDLRGIDWKAYGRTDRFVVKEFEAETNLRAAILLDASSSMVWKGRGLLTKYEYGISLAAGLAQLLLHRGDAVGAARFDTAPTDILLPSAHPAHLHALLQRLAEEPAGRGRRTDIVGSIEALAQRLGRLDLVVVISDLLDDPDEVVTGLARLGSRGARVVALQTLDPIEAKGELPQGDAYEDSETGAVIGATGIDAAEYRRRVDHFIGAITAGCRRHRITHLVVTTDTPFDHPLRPIVG